MSGVRAPSELNNHLFSDTMRGNAKVVQVAVRTGRIRTPRECLLSFVLREAKQTLPLEWRPLRV